MADRQAAEARATYSDEHPHEPEIPPALDAEGRCLICGLLLRVETAEAEVDALSVRLAQADQQIATDAHTFREWRRTIERLEVRLAQAEQERDELLGWLRDEEDGYVRQRALRKEAEVRLREYEEALQSIRAVFPQGVCSECAGFEFEVGEVNRIIDGVAASGGREAPKEPT